MAAADVKERIWLNYCMTLCNIPFSLTPKIIIYHHVILPFYMTILHNAVVIKALIKLYDAHILVRIPPNKMSKSRLTWVMASFPFRPPKAQNLN